MSTRIRTGLGVRTEIATRRIQSFRDGFGQAHLYLACHAAFPLALTPDLLYRLWANFQHDIHGEVLSIPWIAVPDLLLSNLCEEVGHEIYEMDISIRDALLHQFEVEPRFGSDRIKELADFLLIYIQQNLESSDLDTRDFAQAQQWTALSYICPSESAHELAEKLSRLSLENRTEWIRTANLIKTLSVPLAEFKPLLTYASAIKDFLYGDLENATIQFKEIAKTEECVRIAEVNLPLPDQIVYEIKEQSFQAEQLERPLDLLDLEEPNQVITTIPNVSRADETISISSVEGLTFLVDDHSKEEQNKSSARAKDFSRMDIRGRSFKGQDLVGADFSDANIQGADFTETSLIGANFARAKAGSQFLGVLGNTKFNNADLTDANFMQATLKNVDFRNAKLTRTSWANVKGLNTARVDGTYLADPQLRVLLTTLNGRSQNFDSKNLKGLNLMSADLQDASFIEANLNEACLRNANLSHTKLARAQLAEADLSGAHLTGAYIQDWSISASTKLNDVLCDYIYMRLPTSNNPDPWRKPDNRSEVFQEGDFASFIAPIIKTLDLYHNQTVDMRQVRVEVKTLDLYHHEGIDPTAATIALSQLAEANPQVGLEIVGLEGKGDNQVRIKTAIRDEADRSELSSEYFQRYRELTSLPSQNLQELLEGLTEKDEQISSIRKMLMTSLESKKYYIIESAVNQTVENTEANNYASNIISQLPDASDPNQQGVKELLAQLKTAIENCSNLNSSDKDEMFEQVAKIAKATQDPQDNALKKLVVTAIKIIKGTVVGIPVDSDLARTSDRVLPVIMSLLGL